MTCNPVSSEELYFTPIPLQQGSKIGLQSKDDCKSTTEVALACISLLQGSIPTCPDHLSTAAIETNPPLLHESIEDFGLIDLVDTHASIDFQDYLEPNEGTPTNVKPHLDAGFAKQQGFLVSTGTERSFFDLALSDPKKCKGLIVRDINPRVKAYVDFNTMLLRISESMEEYSLISVITPNPGQNFDKLLSDRICEIEAKLIQDIRIPKPVKDYYLRNIQAFGEIYFSQNTYYDRRYYWRKSRDFGGVKYFEDQELFSRLQRYARDGKIVATIGDINDLLFLEDLPISVVDVSNIPDYTIMDFKIMPGCHPTIISTNQHPVCTAFFSCVHTDLSDQEREEMAGLIKLLIKSRRLSESGDVFFDNRGVIPPFGRQFCEIFIENILADLTTTLISSYNETTLKALRSFMENCVIQLTNGTCIFLERYKSNFARLVRDMTIDQVKELSQRSGIEKFATLMAFNWPRDMYGKLDELEKFKALSSIPGLRYYL